MLGFVVIGWGGRNRLFNYISFCRQLLPVLTNDLHLSVSVQVYIDLRERLLRGPYSNNFEPARLKPG